MNLSELFIRRPIMTTLVMASILIFGALAYTKLPVSDLPNVDFPTIQVTASLPGANPSTMASAVATPLEREFSAIAGLDSMTSTSSLGSTQITLQFALHRDIDAAAQDVQVAISRAARNLPKEMPIPPYFRKVNPADQPILRIALTSPTLPLYTLNEYGETLMAQRISMVSGVAQVQVFGAQKYAVRIQLDPKEMASRGIGIDQVAEAVSQANVNLPTGTLYGPKQAFTVQASPVEPGRDRPFGDCRDRTHPHAFSHLRRRMDRLDTGRLFRGIDPGGAANRLQREPGACLYRHVRVGGPALRSLLSARSCLHEAARRPSKILAAKRSVD